MTCPDCEGTGIWPDGGYCESCHGEGRYEIRPKTYAELREFVRFGTRCIEEPMYQTAVTFLLLQKVAIPATLRKAA